MENMLSMRETERERMAFQGQQQVEHSDLNEKKASALRLWPSNKVLYLLFDNGKI